MIVLTKLAEKNQTWIAERVVATWDESFFSGFVTQPLQDFTADFWKEKENIFLEDKLKSDNYQPTYFSAAHQAEPQNVSLSNVSD